MMTSSGVWKAYRPHIWGGSEGVPGERGSVLEPGQVCNWNSFGSASALKDAGPAGFWYGFLPVAAASCTLLACICKPASGGAGSPMAFNCKVFNAKHGTYHGFLNGVRNTKQGPTTTADPGQQGKTQGIFQTQSHFCHQSGTPAQLNGLHLRLDE